MKTCCQLLTGTVATKIFEEHLNFGMLFHPIEVASDLLLSYGIIFVCIRITITNHLLQQMLYIQEFVHWYQLYHEQEEIKYCESRLLPVTGLGISFVGHRLVA